MGAHLSHSIAKQLKVSGLESRLSACTGIVISEVGAVLCQLATVSLVSNYYRVSRSCDVLLCC